MYQMKGLGRIAAIWLLGAAILLSACSGGGGSAGGGANQPANGESGGQEQTTLTFWTVVPTQSQFDQLYARFQELHPDIKIEYQNFQSGDEMSQKLRVALVSGEGPDIFTIYEKDKEFYKDFIEPIKPLADANWGEGWENGFIDAATTATKTKDGTIVGIPLNVVAQSFVLYNKSIFDELGIAAPPKTYDEWKAIVDTIKSESSYIPIALGAKDKWMISDMYVSLANQYAPGKIYEAQDGKASWTDPALVDAMNAWKRMFDDGMFQDGAVGLATYPDARDQYYYSRKAAMFVTGSWHVGSYAMPGGEKWGTAIEGDETGAFLLPQIGPNPARATTSISEIQVINRDSKKKDAAWKWFDFQTNGEGAQIFADILQGSPVKKGLEIGSLDQLQFESDRESVNLVLKELETAVGPMRFVYPELEEAVGIALQDVALGGKTAEEALADIQKVSDKIKRE